MCKASADWARLNPTIIACFVLATLCSPKFPKIAAIPGYIPSSFTPQAMSGNVAAFLLEPRGRFEVRHAPVEQPGPGEVLIEVDPSSCSH